LKSLAVEGTVFWLVVSAFVELGAIAGSSSHVTEGSVVVVLDLIVAYLCWNGRKSGFVSTIVLGLLVAIIAFPFLFGGEQTPFGALIDALVILSALMTVFFGYRALREISAVKAQL
jgi:hypothetical protein